MVNFSPIWLSHLLFGFVGSCCQIIQDRVLQHAVPSGGPVSSCGVDADAESSQYPPSGMNGVSVYSFMGQY